MVNKTQARREKLKANYNIRRDSAQTNAQEIAGFCSFSHKNINSF